MLNYLKGLLVAATSTYIVLEANGLGYKIFIPASGLNKLPQLKESYLVHTSLVIKEMSQTLYGFHEPLERDLFEELLNVNGIGPKTALSLIGHLSLQQLQEAVENDEINKICKVPGIGKKTAERLIIELRDKLNHFNIPQPASHQIETKTSGYSQKIKDAMSALINLGYNQMTAQKAIKKTVQEFSEEIELGLLITHALKNI